MNFWHTTRTGPVFFHPTENFNAAKALYMFLLVIPVTVYVLVIAKNVLFGKLLPQSGRTRVIALYFLRLIGVYVVTWILGFTISMYYFIGGASIVFHASGHFLHHLGGILSVLTALTKPDIEVAVIGLFLCKCNATVEELLFVIEQGYSLPDDPEERRTSRTTTEQSGWKQDDDYEG